MIPQPKPFLSFEDWLAAERASRDGRTEYVNGETFAMASASETHNLIVANVIGELRNQFKGRPCVVYPSDMKVRIEAARTGTYPDVLVVCGPRAFLDESRDVLTNPTVIVEVLSDSTEAWDRGGKFAAYRTLPSLRAFLLLSQRERQAELFVRSDDDTWNLRVFSGPYAVVPLAAAEALLTLAEVYDKVDLPPG
jgi:Uma2 family endonuclease